VTTGDDMNRKLRGLNGGQDALPISTACAGA
jgi:hypothetical protein